MGISNFLVKMKVLSLLSKLLMKESSKLRPINQIRIKTPLGFLIVQANQKMLEKIWWDPDQSVKPNMNSEEKERVDDCLWEAKNQITEYFNRERNNFTLAYHLPIQEKQVRLMKALLTVPFGATISYSELASLSDLEINPRAVGKAMSNNPLPIIFPCHRVIRRDGNFGGYSLGGEKNKQYLLQIEGFTPLKRRK